MVVTAVPQIRFCDLLSLSISSVSAYFPIKIWNWILMEEKIDIYSVCSCLLSFWWAQFQGLESLSYIGVPQKFEPWDVQDVTGILKNIGRSKIAERLD